MDSENKKSQSSRILLVYLDKFSEEYAEDQICSKLLIERIFAFLSEHSVSLYKPK